MKSGNAFRLLPTDYAILQHLALYVVTFREPLQRLFFSDGKDAGNALAALTKQGYLKDAQPLEPSQQKSAAAKRKRQATAFTLPGGKKCYVLGPRSVKAFDLPKERSEPPKAQSLYHNLAVLWYCTMGKARRYRLFQHEVEALFPRETPYHNTVHCLANEKEGPIVYRVYVAATELKYIHKRTRELIEEARRRKALRPWLETGDYGFSLLVETEQKRRKVQQIIENGWGKQTPLIQEARIEVALGPSPETLALALRHTKQTEEAA